MKLTFKLKDKRHINIINEEDGRICGRIFTPSGTGEVIEDAIQVCGFEKIFDYWGCGVFGDGKGNAKRDIQLWFRKDSQDDHQKIGDIISGNSCGRCFYPKEKCKCKEFKLDLRYERVVKEEILKGLEN